MLRDKLTDLVVYLLAGGIIALLFCINLMSIPTNFVQYGELPVPRFIARRRINRILRKLPGHYRCHSLHRPRSKGLVTDYNAFLVTLCNEQGARFHAGEFKYRELSALNLDPDPDTRIVRQKILQLMDTAFPDSPLIFRVLIPETTAAGPARFTLLFQDSAQHYRAIRKIPVRDITRNTLGPRLKKEAFESWFQQTCIRKTGSMDPELMAVADQVKAIFARRFPDSPYQLIEVRYEDTRRETVRLFFEDQRTEQAFATPQGPQKIVKEKVILVSRICDEAFEEHWKGSYL